MFNPRFLDPPRERAEEAVVNWRQFLAYAVARWGLYVHCLRRSPTSETSSQFVIQAHARQSSVASEFAIDPRTD